MDPILSVWCPLCSLNPPGFGCDRSQMPCPQGASCHSWRWSIQLLQGLLCKQLWLFSTSLYLPSLAPPVLYLPSSLPTIHIILRCACVFLLLLFEKKKRLWRRYTPKLWPVFTRDGTVHRSHSSVLYNWGKSKTKMQKAIFFYCACRFNTNTCTVPPLVFTPDHLWMLLAPVLSDFL